MRRLVLPLVLLAMLGQTFAFAAKKPPAAQVHLPPATTRGCPYRPGPGYSSPYDFLKSGYSAPLLQIEGYQQLNLHDELLDWQKRGRPYELGQTPHLFNQIPVDVINRHPDLRDAVQLTAANYCNLSSKALRLPADVLEQRNDLPGPLHDLAKEWTTFLEGHTKGLTEAELFQERDRLKQKYASILIDLPPSKAHRLHQPPRTVSPPNAATGAAKP